MFNDDGSLFLEVLAFTATIRVSCTTCIYTCFYGSVFFGRETGRQIYVLNRFDSRQYRDTFSNRLAGFAGCSVGQGGNASMRGEKWSFAWRRFLKV